jgi:DNA-binding transcriptional MerR regulator
VGTENIFTAELRKILKYKEELLIDIKNMLYHRTDDVERLQKVVADIEEQFADCLQQIKTLGEEKGRWEELEILREAAQTLVDMVDPAEGGEAEKRPLLERLRGVLERVVKFLAEAPVACVSHALAFVKSFWPEAPLGMFAQGVAAECTEEQFNDYLQEAQPVAEQIVQSVL